MELNSAVRPCKLKKIGANAIELLVCFLSLALLVLGGVELLEHSSMSYPWCHTVRLLCFMLFVFFSPLWGFTPDTCLLCGSGGQVRFGFDF